MWHLWLDDGGFKKEVHMCRRCGRDYDDVERDADPDLFSFDDRDGDEDRW